MTKQTIYDYKFYKDLVRLPYVKEIWLFGSRARGDHQNRADIDLAVLCPAATLKEWMTLQKKIRDADTLLKIDCVRLDELDNASSLKQSILMQGIKIYDKL